jgi:hypothetical protein
MGTGMSYVARCRSHPWCNLQNIAISIRCICLVQFTSNFIQISLSRAKSTILDFRWWFLFAIISGSPVVTSMCHFYRLQQFTTRTFVMSGKMMWCVNSWKRALFEDKRQDSFCAECVMPGWVTSPSVIASIAAGTPTQDPIAWTGWTDKMSGKVRKWNKRAYTLSLKPTVKLLNTITFFICWKTRRLQFTHDLFAKNRPIIPEF